MNAFKVTQPEKLDERAAAEAFPRINLKTVEEASTVKRDAARHITRVLHDYSLKFQKIEGGLEPQLKEDEIKRIEKSVKSDAGKIGDSNLDQHIDKLFADAKSGKNPFKIGYIGSMEFHMRSEYGYSTFTTADGTGIAEVTDKMVVERSGREFTVLNTEITGIPRPTSRFFVLKQGASERNFVEITSDPAEDKRTRELLFHLQDVAEGKEEPNAGLIFGHNRFLGGYSRIMPEEHYKRLDNPEYIGFVKKWMETVFKDGDQYKGTEAVHFSNDVEGILGIKDPELWMRVQMLRHLKIGIDELASTGMPNEKVSREKLRSKIQAAFHELEGNHEIQHAINKIEKPEMQDWQDELTAMLTSIHGHSRDYRGSPQFSLAIIVPLFSLAVEKLGKVSDTGRLDYGERAAFALVYGLAKLDKGETPEFDKLDRQLLKGEFNPSEALARLATMESFVLKQRAMELERLAYEQSKS